MSAPSPVPARCRIPFDLCAIDIDDTLVGHDKRVGAENRKAVAELRRRGCEVLLASGRRHVNMLPYLNTLGLSGYVVSCQGARVQHSVTGEIVHQAWVPVGAAGDLVEEGLRRGHTVFVWLEEAIYANAGGPWVDAYAHDSGGDPVVIQDLSSLPPRPAEKIVWSGPPKEIAEAERDIRGQVPSGVDALITNDWYLEFLSTRATKAAGVEAVAKRLGIPRERVLAFGDGHNDVPLLRWAGLGVAMPHGRESARRAARRVAPVGVVETALARGIEEVLAGRT